MKGYGESVIELSPGLKKKPVDTFTPANFQQLNNGDTDFGSGGAMLIPPVNGQTAPPMLVAMGKASTLYLLNSTHLGGLEGHNGNKPLQKFQVGGGCWCGPAYYVGPGGGIVYYQSGGDVLRSFSVATGATPKLTQLATGTTGAGYGGSFPVVSSNGATAGTGVVWLIRRDTTEQLEAYDAVSLGTPAVPGQCGQLEHERAVPLPARGERPCLRSGLPDGHGVRADKLEELSGILLRCFLVAAIVYLTQQTGRPIFWIKEIAVMAKGALNNPIFQDKTKAREWLETLLWKDGRPCGYCGVVDEIRPSRAVRPTSSAMPAEAIYGHCGHGFRAQPYPAQQVADGCLPALCVQEGHQRPPDAPHARHHLQVGLVHDAPPARGHEARAA